MTTASMSVTSINERAAEEYYKRATAALTEGSEERAVDFFERTLAENPDHEDACFALARLYDRHAEDEKAIELYERICSGSPVPLNALINLAVLYEDHADYDQARRCLQAVLATNPNHERARLYMKDVESAYELVADEERRGEKRDAVLDTPISDFELSVRSRTALKKMNVRVLGDLLLVSEPELLSFKNFGETSLNEIKSLLASRGLRLGQQAGDPTSRPRTDIFATEGMMIDAPAAASGPAEYLGEGSPESAGKPLSDVELSVRSRKALQRLNIHSLGELASRSEDDLLSCKNFGLTSLNELKQILAQHGMGLRKNDE